MTLEREDIRVLVAVPTFRRPDALRVLLHSLEAADQIAPVDILVVDNDADRQEGAQLVTAEFPNICAVIESGRGLSTVRNRMVEAFRAEPGYSHLAMCDDDQRVDPAWLRSALEDLQSYGADALGCAVHPEFIEEPPAWALHTSIYRRPVVDGVVEILQGTGGVVFTRRCLTLKDTTWFNPAYGFSGGEDADFFRSLRRTGGVMARSSRSIVMERYEPERVSRGWVLRRAYRTGLTDAHIALSHASDRKSARRSLLWSSLRMMAKGLTGLPGGVFGPDRAMNALSHLWRAVGTLAALSARDLPTDYKAAS